MKPTFARPDPRRYPTFFSRWRRRLRAGGLCQNDGHRKHEGHAKARSEGTEAPRATEGTESSSRSDAESSSRRHSLLFVPALAVALRAQAPQPTAAPDRQAGRGHPDHRCDRAEGVRLLSSPRRQGADVAHLVPAQHAGRMADDHPAHGGAQRLEHRAGDRATGGEVPRRRILASRRKKRSRRRGKPSGG